MLSLLLQEALEGEREKYTNGRKHEYKFHDKLMNRERISNVQKEMKILRSNKNLFLLKFLSISFISLRFPLRALLCIALKLFNSQMIIKPELKGDSRLLDKTRH